MALNYTDAKAMYAASEAHPNLTTMISPPPHFMRGDRAIRKMIDARGLGHTPLYLTEWNRFTPVGSNQEPVTAREAEPTA